MAKFDLGSLTLSPFQSIEEEEEEEEKKIDASLVLTTSAKSSRGRGLPFAVAPAWYATRTASLLSTLRD